MTDPKHRFVRDPNCLLGRDIYPDVFYDINKNK